MGSCAGRLRAPRARYAAEFRAAAAARLPRAGARTRAILVSVAPVKRADFPSFSRASDSAGLQHRDRPRAVDGQVVKIAFKEGERQRGRPARRDRSAAVPGRARSGEGEEDARRGQSRQCAAGPATLSTLAKQSYATQQQLDTQDALVNQLIAQIAADVAAIDAAQSSSITPKSAPRSPGAPGSVSSTRAIWWPRPSRPASS